MEPLIEVINLSKSYEQSILDHLCFKMDQGEIVGLVGESGCGKSTLGKLLVGIEKPTTGKIVFENHVFDEKKDRKDVQSIFQNPIESFSPRMKIKQFLYEPCHYFKHLSKKEALELIKTILKQVGMDETCLEKYPHELSGGQLQRIAIARALIVEPKLLVCDEITSSIDQVLQKELIQLLYDYVIEKKTTLLFISHDIHLVQSFCKRVIVINQGKIIEDCLACDLDKSNQIEVQKLLQSSYLKRN